jgi:hypothetical protein
MTSGNRVREPVVSPAAWRATDVGDVTQWTHVLGEAERDEIVAAANAARAEGLGIGTLTRERFALPGLASKLDAWVEELDQGRGFLLLRRFPTDRLPADAVELAFVGLGLHLGTPVSQDAHGSILGHVRDERQPRDTPAVRLYRTNARQDFHTDGADLVGLLCLRDAKVGGESKIASAHAVYNEMLRRRPDLVDVLFQPLPWDRNDEQGDSEAPFYMLPAFTEAEGKPRVFFIAWYIRDSQRHAQAPRLSTQQLEALALLEGIANDPRIHVSMDFAPGDLQFINNAKILHAREAYEDHQDPERRRHLLRLWLAASRFTSVDEALRQGIPRRH